MKDDNRKGPAAMAATVDMFEADAIEQVRELLLGPDRRATDAKLDQIDAKQEKRIAELRADMTARFAELENRLEAATRDLEDKRLTSIDDIGAAIATLGASVRALGPKHKAR